MEHAGKDGEYKTTDDRRWNAKALEEVYLAPNERSKHYCCNGQGQRLIQVDGYFQFTQLIPYN